MYPRSFFLAVAVAVPAALSCAGGALGDSPASDAAQTCIQGRQIDYFQAQAVDEENAPVLDFGNLVHGADEAGPYIVAGSKGDCESFIAKNTKGNDSSTNGQTYFVIKLTSVYVSGT
jgi:hypothetical protein